MAKIIVIIENTEDGQPIWDEASIKQLHDVIRPGAKPNHHDRRDDHGDVLLHYSSPGHRTDDGNNSRPSSTASAKAALDDELHQDLGAGFTEYEFEA